MSGIERRLAKLERDLLPAPPKRIVEAIHHAGSCLALVYSDGSVDMETTLPVDRLPPGVGLYEVVDLRREIAEVEQSLREEGVQC
jgi:hypothetical protein